MGKGYYDDDYGLDAWLDEGYDGLDTEWCIQCEQDVGVFKNDDDRECCEVCNNPLSIIGDEFATSDTARTTLADAPTISKGGDIWGRGKGFTWGSSRSWWQEDKAYGGSMSGMWGSTTTFNSSFNTFDKDAYRMNKHRNHLDSLCKVVDPNVKHTLSFASSSSACTNMKTGDIYIDGSLLKKDDSNLDITAGLSIHEKLHLIHTKPATHWEGNYNYDNDTTRGERELLHSIINIVEDEYIEQQLHKTCAGFVHYIDKVKKHYFEGEQNALEDLADKHKFGDVLNTLLLFVRYPSMIDGKRKHRHKRHITFFAKALKNGLKDREATLKCFETLFNYLKKVAETMTSDDDDLSEAMEEAMQRTNKMRDNFDEMGDSLTEDEWKDIEKRFLEDEMKRMKDKDKLLKLLPEEVMETLRKLTGEGDKDELSKALIDKMKDMAESDYEETELGNEIAFSSRQKKISWERVRGDDRTKRTYEYDRRRVSKDISKLKKKITLYGNESVYNIYNQKRGKLDKRKLHKIPMGVNDMFKATIRRQDKPLDICLLVDESGSMGYNRMDEARQCAIAVKEALCDNPMLNLWVFGHSADYNENGMTEMREYYSPTMKDRPFAMGDMKSRCENRDGNAIVTSADRVKEQSDQPQANKLMIVFSDGSPSADRYRGMEAVKHTGWSVIQLGFGGAYEETVKKMFTNYQMIDTEDMGNQTAKIIRKVLKI